MNNCTFAGNVGNDPEKKSGKKVDFLTFNIAVRQRGSDEPLWISCASFNEGLNDNVIEKYVKKGSMVVVSGELSVFEGDKGSRLQLSVNSLTLGGGRGDDKPVSKSSKSSSRSRDDDEDDRPSKRRRDDDDDDRRERRTKSRDEDDDLDDEIPF